MASDLDIINAALTRMGNPTLANLTGGDAATTIANANYEIKVKAELARSRFKLPSKFANLVATAATVPDPWLFGYDLPADLVKLATIKVAGIPIEYEQIGQVVYCNYEATAADPVVAHYLWRLTTTSWAPEFVEGIIMRMHAVFLRGLPHDYDAAEAMDKMANEQLGFAKSSDSQAQTPRRPVGSPALRARVGEVASSATLVARRG